MHITMYHTLLLLTHRCCWIWIFNGSIIVTVLIKEVRLSLCTLNNILQQHAYRYDMYVRLWCNSPLNGLKIMARILYMPWTTQKDDGITIIMLAHNHNSSMGAPIARWTSVT